MDFSDFARLLVIIRNLLAKSLELSVSEYIKELLSKEIYSFTKDEIIQVTGKESNSISSDLSYLNHKGEIVVLRKGFYLIIPPRYSKIGIIPVDLYVDNLFKYLEREYYVGLYSAAQRHGASHQQIQKEYIITSGHSLLSIKKKNIQIQFFTITTWPDSNLIKKKSDAGYFNVSDPVLTAADLIYHQRKLGGINRMLANLEELAENITIESIQNLVEWYPHKSVLQRLGFLLDEINSDSQLTNFLFNWLSTEEIFPVLLSPKRNMYAGAVSNRWKVDVNLELENDL